MESVKAINEKIAAKAKALHDIFEEAGKDMDLSLVKSLSGDNTVKAEQIKAMNKELDDLSVELAKAQKESTDLSDMQKKAAERNTFFNEPAGNSQHPAGDAGQKSLGQLFVESKAYTKKGDSAYSDVNLKTVMSISGAGWAPEATRTGRVVLTAGRPIAVVDAFPIFTTNMNAVKYMYEETFTNNAAEVAESVEGTLVTYGAAALKVSEASVPVEKIGVYLPVTDEQLEDTQGIADYINSRMTYMVQARLDGQLVAGNGTPPNLRGVLNAASIQTQALGADPVPDAIYKAMTLVRSTGFAEPSAVLIHPNDWQTIRLLRTADGIYIFGNPQETMAPSIWGVPVIVTTAETENTAVVGDFRNYAALYLKRGIEFKVTDSHSTWFVSAVQAIRADMRCAAVYFRGTAFCKVTGI